MSKQKQKKKKKKAKKQDAVKVILMNDEDTDEEEDIDDDEEDEEGGIHLEKEDILLIYNALKYYKPVNVDEEMLSEVLLEQFEEILILTVRPFLRWFRRNGAQPCIEH